MSSLSLQYYTFDETNGLQLPSAGQPLSAWQEELIRRMDSAVSTIREGCIIQVVLADPAHFKKGSQFLKNLTQGPLRRIEPLSPEQKRTYAPHPVITVGLYDLMGLYEEAPGLDFEDEDTHMYWKDARKEQQTLYKQGFDHRLKFLDSSIWHRYVPYARSAWEQTDRQGEAWEAGFEAAFAHVVRQMIRCHQQGLYQSVAAIATLEFQCRILNNSFIPDFGAGGHHALVTPFKFHSETRMEQKCSRFRSFFQKKYGDSSLSALRWRVLMVDDHSKDEMNRVYAYPQKQEIETETAPLQAIPIRPKKDIIEDLLSDPDNETDPLNLHLELETTTGGTNIIQQAIDYLKKTDLTAESSGEHQKDEKTFEIILLDYLLGNQEVPGLEEEELRAYGHEFLLELATSPDRLQFRRGPANRFWIFPISSFPFAFGDKLRQMNLDGTGERWIIANGGDPISTPALFRLNFYRLLLRQISEYYLHEAAFIRWLRRLDSLTRPSEWHRALKLQIEAERFKKTRLGDRRNISAFAASMERFLDGHPWYSAFLERLYGWLPLVANYRTGESHDDLLTALKDITTDLSVPEKITRLLQEQIQRITRDAGKELLDRQLQGGTLHFSNKNLYFLPDRLFQTFPDVEELSLSGNYLKVVPPDICHLLHLRRLDLSDNRHLQFLPATRMLEAMHQKRWCLISLDLSDTAVQEAVSPHSRTLLANTAEEVRLLLEKIARHNRTSQQNMALQLQKKGVTKIFISYAKEDDECRANLRKHLKPLEQSGKILVWDDQSLRLGREVEDQIKAQIKEADIFLLIISADFMHSHYIQERELRLIELRNRNEALIIPIYYRQVYHSTHYTGSVQGLPADGHRKPIRQYGDQDEAYTEIARKLDQLLSKSPS